MSLILTAGQIAKLRDIVEQELLDAGADHVLIVDMAGNLILEHGSMETPDLLALAVLSAANFAATSQIAKLIGEESFSILFHKGDNKNIHFSQLGRDYIIVTLFDDSISLGLIRLKIGQVIENLMPVFQQFRGK